MAILLVVVGHFIYLGYVNWARLGVEFFFVLSGRLMAEILFVKEARLRSFYLRRFARIYPALAVFCVASALVFYGTDKQVNWQQLLASLTLTSNYAMFFLGMPDIQGHIWSLCVEEHMYLLLGLIAFANRKFRLPVIPTIAIIAAAFAAQGVFETLAGKGYYEVYWRSDVRGASLLMGALAFLIVHKFNIRLPALTSLALGMAAIYLNLYTFQDGTKYTIGTACLALSLASMPRTPRPFQKILEVKGMVAVGVLSYSLYLWQEPFYIMMHGGSPMPLMLGVALVCAVISYFVIEKPSRRYLNGLIERSRFSRSASASGTSAAGV